MINRARVTTCACSLPPHLHLLFDLESMRHSPQYAQQRFPETVDGNDLGKPYHWISLVVSTSVSNIDFPINPLRDTAFTRQTWAVIKLHFTGRAHGASFEAQPCESHNWVSDGWFQMAPHHGIHRGGPVKPPTRSASGTNPRSHGKTIRSFCVILGWTRTPDSDSFQSCSHVLTNMHVHEDKCTTIEGQGQAGTNRKREREGVKGTSNRGRAVSNNNSGWVLAIGQQAFPGHK